MNREAGRPSKHYTQYLTMAKGKVLVDVLKQIIPLLIIFSGKTFDFCVFIRLSKSMINVEHLNLHVMLEIHETVTMNREAGRPSKHYTQYLTMAKGKVLVDVLKQIIPLLIIFSGKTFDFCVFIRLSKSMINVEHLNLHVMLEIQFDPEVITEILIFSLHSLYIWADQTGEYEKIHLFLSQPRSLLNRNQSILVFHR